MEQVEAKCNTLTLNLKEDIVSEIFNTLKNINLLSDKKTMESRQRSLLVEELLKGYAGLNDLKKLSLKFETKNASSKSSKNILVRRLKIHAISCTLSYIKKSNLQLDDIQDHAILSRNTPIQSICWCCQTSASCRCTCLSCRSKTTRVIRSPSKRKSAAM